MKKSSKTRVRAAKTTAEAAPAPVASYTLTVTLTELVHLRDLFAVTLPPEMSMTVSQALAATEYRGLVEARLWNKVSKLCVEAEIPMESGAPDYVVTVSGPPPMGVFRLEPNLEAPTNVLDGELTDESEA